jgi:hypothetical protein
METLPSGGYGLSIKGHGQMYSMQPQVNDSTHSETQLFPTSDG